MADVGLLFKIKADSAQAKQEITSLRGTVTKEIGGLTSGLASSAAGNLGIFGAVANSLSRALIGVSQSAGPATEATKKIGEESGKAGAEVASLTSDVSTTTTTLKQFAGTAGLAVGGIVALAGAAVGAATAAFSLAKSAAEAGSRINDLSIKTGLSAETLSGLDLQAKQSGTSIEALSTGVFALQKNMAAAADGNKELATTFKDLGVDVKGTTDGALRQLFKSLAAIPDEGRRNAEGAKVMGRAYQELSVLFKDVDGDMDAVIKRAREMGLVISGEAAAAADKFGDDLDRLNAKLAGISREIGMVLVPAVNDAMNSISGSLAANQSSWTSWAEHVVNIVRNVGKAIQLIAAFQSSPWEGIGELRAQSGADADRAYIAGLMKDPDLANERARMSAVSNRSKMPPFDFSPSGKSGGGKKGGGGGGGAKKEPDSNQLEITRQETERFYKEQEEIVNRSYERQLKTIEEFTEEQVTLEQRRSTALRALLIEEMAKITEKGEARKNKERTINEEIAALEEQTQRAIIQIRDKGAEEAEKIEQARREKFEASRKAEDDLKIARIEVEVQERTKTESKAEDEITAIRLDALARRVELMKIEQAAFRAGSEEHLKIQGELAAAESEKTRIAEEGAQRRIEAVRRETENAMQQGIFKREAEIRSEEADPSSGRSIFGDVFAEATNEGASNMEAFGDTVRSVLGSISASAGNVRTMMGDLFSGIAQGVGSGIKSFILLGNFGAAGLRKFAAEAIASVAAQAAVKAIFEVAEGFAALARFDPVSAASHFAAAKFYGILAGVAAVAGRAVAGSAFANDAKPAPVGVGSGGTNQPSRPEDRTVRESRGGGGQQTIIIRLESGLVGEKVAQEVRNNGPLRNLIVETAKG